MLPKSPLLPSEIVVSTAIWTEDLSNCQLDEDIELRIRVAVNKQLEDEEILTRSDSLLVQACCGPLCFSLITFRGTGPYASSVLFRAVHDNQNFDVITPSTFYEFCWRVNLNYSAVCSSSEFRFKIGVTAPTEFIAIDDFQYHCVLSL